MKKLLVITLATVLCGTISAQQTEKTSNWKNRGVAGLNLSQVGLSNWAAGGDASVAFDANFGYSIDYAKEKTIWNNRLEFAYGMNNTTSNGTRKTNDKIYLSSNYGYKVADNLYLSALLTFNTQFDKGYTYKDNVATYTSTFMAPGYLSYGPGVNWKPKEWLIVNASPVTAKHTFVYDTELSSQGVYGVKAGENTLFELGGNVNIEFKKDIFTNVSLYSRLNLFTNYLHKPENIDVKWDNILSMKVNKWLSATLQFNIIYDDDSKIALEDGRKVAKLQVKEVLGIGIQVNF